MIVAALPVLYGADYFRHAIASVDPFVDRVVALYATRPSFGHQTDQPCPETEDQMRACCDAVAHKLTWIRGDWSNEGEQRRAGYDAVGDADLILQPDTDEVWNPASLENCIRLARNGQHRNWMIQGWFHFWRSFNFACTDVWAPIRIIKPSGEGTRTIPGTVYHFGYAITEKLMAYKWLTSSHGPELRQDWMRDIFLANRKTDCHPCVFDWWNAQPFDKTTLPEFMYSHPFYDKDLIA